MNRDLNALFETLGTRLEECHTSYLLDKELLEADISIAYQKKSLEVNRELFPSERYIEAQKVYDNKAKEVDSTKKCIDESKVTFNASAPNVLKEIKDENLKVKSREILAQWLTTIDTVPEKNYPQELNKYKNLRNNFQLEFPSN